jgi:hypothetical protein
VILLLFLKKLQVSETIAPRIHNWIRANNSEIKLCSADLNFLAESGLTGGHVSDFLMKGAFVAKLKGILRVSLYKLVDLKYDLVVLLDKIGSTAADDVKQQNELGKLGKKRRLTFEFTRRSALKYFQSDCNIFPKNLLEDLEDFQLDGLAYLKIEIKDFMCHERKTKFSVLLRSFIQEMNPEKIGDATSLCHFAFAKINNCVNPENDRHLKKVSVLFLSLWPVYLNAPSFLSSSTRHLRALRDTQEV